MKMKFFQKIITSKIVEEAVANAAASIVDEIGREIAIKFFYSD